MHIDSTPRTSAITNTNDNPADTAREKHDPSVTPSQEAVFSKNHISEKKSVPAAAEKSPDTPTVTQSDKEKVFQKKQMSRRLERAEEKARQALGSEKNKMYQTNLGILSPEAEEAVNHYAALFNAKSSNPGVPNAVRDAFDENFITPDEEQRWQDIQRQLPAALTSHGGASVPIGSIKESEMSSAIFREPGFRVFEGTRQGMQFVKELMQIVNKKSAAMAPMDKGMALVFRFPGTYGAVGHIALGSLWRDANGAVQLDISHQESMAPTPKSGNVYTGRIFNTFDTAAAYPTGIAPVVESMKLFGPPSVLVFPVPFPERLAPYTQLFKDHEVTYGATEGWLPGKKSTISAKIHKETCFNVTQKTLARLFGITTTHEPLLPILLPKMKGLAGIPKEKFTEFMIKNKKQTLESTASDESLATAVFMDVGPNWIMQGTADVEGKTTLESCDLKFQPGQQDVKRPEMVHGFKFSSEAPALKDLRLDGKPVTKGKVYSAEEAGRMVFIGKEPPKGIRYVVAVPLKGQAKL